MTCLPAHGRVQCTRCFQVGVPVFDESERSEQEWKITWNPLAWGDTRPTIVVLGFSKGPTQKGALRTAPHDAIAYKGSRPAVGKILARIGLLPRQESPKAYGRVVDQLIANPQGQFHFSSFIRCTVERWDAKEAEWLGTGGGMLDKFMASSFGARVASTCAQSFLRDLPSETKLIVMFGLGTKRNYVEAAFGVFQQVRGGTWRRVNDVAYSDGKLTVVHVEHFASRGSLIPDWLGETGRPRGRLSVLAHEAASQALAATR